MKEMLGPYRVLEQLGEGGMGQVYRARDTRLDRDVALKILPPHLNGDPEFRQRFDREARAISQLAHPNICRLYDVGEDGGQAFLVMECLAGQTLADRLARGALPLDEALRTALQIADALDAAHRRGIVHRDLKPGNVMLTADGAKLLDFGLAKSVAAPPVPGLSMLPTTPPVTGATAVPLTARGTILGTFQYMAPEQLEGLDADARTDIFAFGAVLYEMLTGRKAFQATSQASLIAAILERQPEPLLTIAPVTPVALEHVVALCLAKDRDARWQNIRDVREQLRWIAASRGTSTPHAMAAVQPPRRFERLAWVFAILLAAGATAAIGQLRRPRLPEPPVTRLSVPLPDGSSLFLFEQGLAISPDGRRLVYRAQPGPMLFVRSLDSDVPLLMRGTERPESPFFSPDGEWLAFFSGGKLKRVPVTGGTPIEICDVVSTGRGGTWGPDGSIIFATADVDFTGLLRVPARGGTPERLAAPPPGGRYAWPVFLPDGRTILFAASEALAGDISEAQIVVRRLDTGEQRTVFTGGTLPRLVGNRHLVVARGGTLFALPFDPSRLEVTGPAVPVLDGVAGERTADQAGGVTQYAVSPTGTLVYATASSDVLERELVWVTRDGQVSRVEGLQRPMTEAAVSPDGRSIAFSQIGENRNIWTFDIARRTVSRLSFGKGIDQFPRWTPDGRRIAYSSTQDGPFQIYWKASDGSGAEELLIKADVPGNFPRAWSPDGRWLLYQRGTAAAANDLWIAAADGSEPPRPFVATPANETSAQFSPDGRWVAYQSNETGRSEVYVQSFPTPGGKWQISTEGGVWPRWRHDGRELLFRTGDALVAVPVTTTPAFNAGTPQKLFTGTYELPFDVARDGGRFLMIRGKSGAASPRLNVVLNWSTELQRPTGPSR